MAESLDIRFLPADRASLEQRAAIMNAAYADYYVPVRVTPEQLARFDDCHDVDLAHSVVVQSRWEPVGMALLARRGERAWISAVGVLPAWRRRGIARHMMTHLLASARSLKIERASLEVIAENKPAQALYLSLGFRVQRELLTWRRPATAEPLPVPVERLAEMPPRRLLESYAGWHEQPACWQREGATLGKMADRLKGFRLDWRGKPTAYCLVGGADSSDGAVSLMDVGVNPQSGLLMPGRLLLQALAVSYFGRSFSIMNVPADDSLVRILAALGFHVAVRQVEMALDL
jgi:GNAT superfamily N-acetyltransferase